MAELKLPPLPTRKHACLSSGKCVGAYTVEEVEGIRADILEWTAAWMQEHLIGAGSVISDFRRKAAELRAAAYKIGCQHERLNDNEDACLDCGAVFVDGKWQ